MPVPGDFVMIRYLDHWLNQGRWMTVEQMTLDPVKITVVGWLVKQDSLGLLVAAQKVTPVPGTDGPVKYSSINYILRFSIIEIETVPEITTETIVQEEK